MRHRSLSGWQALLMGGLWLPFTAGCASQSARIRALEAEVQLQRQQAVTDQAKLETMQQRLEALETPRPTPSVDEHATLRLEIAISRLDAMLKRVAKAPQPSCEDRPANPEAEGWGTTSESSPETVQRIVERLRGDPERWRGPLTPNDQQALRQLTRPVRSLDSENPWY